MTHCPVCGISADGAPLLTVIDDLFTGTGRHSVVQCAACSVAFTAGAQPDARVIYGDSYLPYQAAGQSKALALLALVQARSPRLRYLRRGGRVGPVLDLGCGNATTVRLLRSVGVPAYGLDLTSTALAAAPANAVVVGSPLALPFAANKLGGINLHHVLEHSDNPILLLQEVARTLRADGFARIAVPAVAEESPDKFDQAHPGWDVPRHRVHFTRSTLSRAVRAAGLEVASVNYWPEPSFRLLTSERPPDLMGRVVRRARAHAVEIGVLLYTRRSAVLEMNVYPRPRRQSGSAPR